MFKSHGHIILVFFHLMLLGYPQMIKSAHVHHHVHAVCLHDHGISFDHPEASCPVCDFEFVNFIENLPSRLLVYLPAIQLTEPRAWESRHHSLLLYFSLRAPPLS